MKEDKSDPLIDEDSKVLKEFVHYISDYKKLRKRRMNCFNEQGNVIMLDRRNGKEELCNGRDFILNNMAFFEREDKAYCYNICADLKKVLDEYDAKFPSNVST